MPVQDPAAALERTDPIYVTFDRLTRALLGAAVALTTAGLTIVTFAHLDDRYMVNHVSGSWLALAQDLRRGIYYPAFFDGSQYGGTRYMPFPILVNGGAAAVFNDYLLSGKLVALVLAIAAVLLTYALLRQSAAPPRLLAAGLVAAAVVTPTTTLALWSIRGDSLSVVVALGALVGVRRSERAPALIVAGLLCSAAAASKLSALWAPLAIGLWLVGRRNSRGAVTFGSAFLGGLAAVVAAVELATRGRFLHDVFGLTFAGSGSAALGPAATVRHLAWLAVIKQNSVWYLVPVAVAVIFVALVHRRLTLVQLALCCSGLSLLVVLRDVGADYNHLLDATLLVAVVVGEGVARSGRWRNLLLPACSLVVVVGLAISFHHVLQGPLLNVVQGRVARSTVSRRPLNDLIGERSVILSEDPTIPVLLGQRPLVEDPFLLARIGQQRPDLLRALTRRIRSHSFEAVILLRPLADTRHFAVLDFGSRLRSLLVANYRLEQVRDGGTETYWVYRPR